MEPLIITLQGRKQFRSTGTPTLYYTRHRKQLHLQKNVKPLPYQAYRDTSGLYKSRHMKGISSASTAER
jgi:hypothetical protein